jgi:hypothetical protein
MKRWAALIGGASALTAIVAVVRRHKHGSKVAGVMEPMTEIYAAEDEIVEPLAEPPRAEIPNIRP